MKNFPAPLIAYLRTHSELPFIEDLFIIQLPNGQDILATSGQMDIVNAGATPPTTFSAVKFGKWNRGTITSQASFDMTPGTMELTFTDNGADAGGPVLFPGGTLTLLNAVAAGLFDQARVFIFTAYMPTYGDTTLGFETKYLGDITAVTELDRSHATFEVSDLLYLLLKPYPPDVFQAPCEHMVFNSNCALDPAAFRVTSVAALGSTQSLIIASGALAGVGNDPLPYTQGVLTFTTGNNAGLSSGIRQQSTTTQLVLDVPAFMAVQPGDVFTILPGCNKLMATCLLKYNNLIHYLGEPFTPVPETSL